MLITVLMPVYNADGTVADAIRDILQQTYKALELIVIEDGSSDDTLSAIEGCREDRLRVIESGTNLGVQAALSMGLQAARGELIARMDADDRCDARRLERQLVEFRRNPRLGLLGTAGWLINESGAQVLHRPATRDRTLQSRMMFGNRFLHGSAMFQRSVARLVGGYREGFDAAEDYDLWLRISEVAEIANLGEPLYRLSLHASSVSAIRSAEQTQDAARALEAAIARRRGEVDEQGGRLDEAAAVDRLGRTRFGLHRAQWALGLWASGRSVDARTVLRRRKSRR